MKTVWVKYKRPTKKRLPGKHSWSYIGTHMTSVTQEELVAMRLGHQPTVSHIKVICGHDIYAVDENLNWVLFKEAIVLEIGR